MDERAWAAGFFDAEGWVGAVPKPRRRPHLQASISQYSVSGVPEVLGRFHAAVGLRGRVSGPFKTRPAHYQWHASGLVVVECMSLMWEHLGSPKRQQAARAIEVAAIGDAPASARPPETSLAWCAGLFDGDGSVGLVRLRRARSTGRRGIHATVTQVGVDGPPEVLIRFYDRVGLLGTVNGPSLRPGLGDVYRWQSMRREHVRNVVDLLSPWLGSVKREQALRALRVIEAQAPLRMGGGHLGYRKRACVRGHDFSDVLTYERLAPSGLVYLQRVCRECRRERDRATRSTSRSQARP